MKDTELYEHILQLKAPWSVKKMDLSLADQRVVVEVVLKRGQVWGDPTDATKRAHINGWTERQWRHLDTCQFETLIKARVPQLKYADGTVEELKVPWAERYSRVTTLMAAFVIKLLQACPTTQAVCTLTRLSWSTVNNIMNNAVERGMLRRTEEEISYIGIDEKSSERGHTYASILTDIDNSRVLDLVPERKLAAAVSLLETLTPAQRVSVKAVAMDMWPAYMSAVKQCAPQADIVHDKFHVSKYLGEAVDAVRKQEHRKLSKAGTSPLAGSKWAWMKKYPDGRSAEAVSFRALNQLNLKTSRAWRIKENFSHFWSYRYKGAARNFFKAWSNNAMRSRLEPVNVASRMIKANARGFRNFTNYRARILFHCGKLNLDMA